MRLKIEKAVYGGFGLARDEDARVILVRGALPGETVDAVVVKRKKDYAVAGTVAVLERSPSRVTRRRAPSTASAAAAGSSTPISRSS